MSLLFAEFIRKLQVYLSRIPLSGMEVERVTVGKEGGDTLQYENMGRLLMLYGYVSRRKKKG